MTRSHLYQSYLTGGEGDEADGMHFLYTFIVIIAVSTILFINH